MRHYPGKIYAFLPAAVESVGLKASAAVRAGGTLRYEAASSTSRARPSTPVSRWRCASLDPAGATALEVYRAATPVLTGAYAVPANAPDGNWTLRVRELVSGAAAEAPVGGAGGEAPAGAGGRGHRRHAGQAEGPRLRPERIRLVLIAQEKGRTAARPPPAHRAGRLRTVRRPSPIPLGQAQAWARPVAERLREELARRGPTEHGSCRSSRSCACPAHGTRRSRSLTARGSGAATWSCRASSPTRR